MYNKEYLDCICTDMDHAIRLSYDSECEYFWFEHRNNKFPGETKYYKVTNKFQLLKEKTIGYLLNVWHAIKGNPNIYTICTELDRETAEKMIVFLEKFVKEDNHSNLLQ
jgi:hypothetical protein